MISLGEDQNNIYQGISEEKMVNGGRDMINWKGTLDGDELTRVETCAVEFDWIFCGNNAISFIQHLAHKADESIFAVETIKVIVLFLWERFFF